MRRCGLPALFLLAINASMCRADDPVIDPRAQAVLVEMTKAYTDLRTLEQETTWEPGGDMGRMVRSRLVIQRPNRVLLEITERRPPIPDPVTSHILCDGKKLFTHIQPNGWFETSKAPKDLAGFMFTTCVEMAAIGGADPFSQILRQARSLVLEGPEILDGVNADILSYDLGNKERNASLRLYVGREDHLIRRFVMDSNPIPREKKPDELSINDPPVHIRYENKLVANKGIAKGVFVWIPPPGVIPFQSSLNPMLNQGVNPRKGRAAKKGQVIDIDKYRPWEHH